MNQPIEVDRLTITEIISILREYKKMKQILITGEKQVIRLEDDATIDNLIKKFGLCWWDEAPFKLMLHPTEHYSLENIAKYVIEIEKEDT